MDTTNKHTLTELAHIRRFTFHSLDVLRQFARDDGRDDVSYNATGFDPAQFWQNIIEVKLADELQNPVNANVTLVEVQNEHPN